ncbi:hypothetical protein [Photobacterium leiognathi]|uniref:hypothetical protein n=1 Tax=Photobacterium leiognathi TaxID=553611 RepID=UPI0029822F59|nr:hypothetical protein [Photobacterium leiognathi]
MINRKLLVLLPFSLFLFSNHSLATCPTGVCPPIKDVDTITGSALGFVTSTATDIATTGASIATEIGEQSSALISASSSNTKTLVMSDMSNTQEEIANNAEVRKSVTIALMDQQAELAASKIKSKSASLSVDDTLEEYQFIQNFLESNKEVFSGNVSIAAELMVRQYDSDPDFKLPYKPFIAESCDDSSKCYAMKKSLPGSKLKQIIQKCSTSKLKKVSSIQAKKSSIASKLRGSQKLNRVASSSNSQLSVSERQSDSIELTCSLTDKRMGFCSKDVDESQYLDRVHKNDIIPNGSISAANFIAPVSVGGLEYVDESEIPNLIDAYASSSLDLSEGVDANAPDIVDTYRNDRQLKSAIQFRDNVLMSDFISNQGLSDRLSPASSEFQSLFMSRQAKLSLVGSVLDESIALRTGRVLTDLRMAEDIEDYDGEMIKESVNGAGLLDIISHQINEDFSKISIYSADPGQALASLANASETSVALDENQARARALQIKLMQLKMLEKQKLLMGAKLASVVNSPENTLYLKKLRGYK